MPGRSARLSAFGMIPDSCERTRHHEGATTYQAEKQKRIKRRLMQTYLRETCDVDLHELRRGTAGGKWFEAIASGNGRAAAEVERGETREVSLLIIDILNAARCNL